MTPRLARETKNMSTCSCLLMLVPCDAGVKGWAGEGLHVVIFGVGQAELGARDGTEGGVGGMLSRGGSAARVPKSAGGAHRPTSIAYKRYAVAGALAGPERASLRSSLKPTTISQPDSGRSVPMKRPHAA